MLIVFGFVLASRDEAQPARGRPPRKPPVLRHALADRRPRK